MIAAFGSAAIWIGTAIGLPATGRCFFRPPAPDVYHYIDFSQLESFWPVNYVFNASGVPGRWLFAGTRNVPEAGGALL